MLEGREFNVFTPEGNILFMHRHGVPSSTLVRHRGYDGLAVFEIRQNATKVNAEYFNPDFTLGGAIIVQIMPNMAYTGSLVNSANSPAEARSESVPETTKLYRVLGLQRTFNDDLLLLVIAPHTYPWNEISPSHHEACNFFDINADDTTEGPVRLGTLQKAASTHGSGQLQKMVDFGKGGQSYGLTNQAGDDYTANQAVQGERRYSDQLR